MSEGAVTLGRRLSAERERKSLSVQKVADELHLDGWVIEALESGDHARLGPTVYGKGHLKRYLGLLGLPAIEIQGAYAAESPPPAQASPPAPLRMRTSDVAAGGTRWLPLVGAALAAAAVGAAVWWWRPWHARAVASPTSLAAAAVNTARASGASAEAPAGAGVARDMSDDEAADDGAAAIAAGGTGVGGRTAGIAAGGGPVVASTAKPAAATIAQGETDPNAGAGRARLRLSFSSESWVDVHDALGQRVYAGNGRANSVKTIAGAAPLRVYLKSASGVQLEINNHAVAIGSRFVVGNVAHFEAGADGVLRRDSRALGVAAADGVLRRDSRALGAAPSAASSGSHPRG